jgi:hypothetical protein
LHPGLKLTGPKEEEEEEEEEDGHISQNASPSLSDAYL